LLEHLQRAGVATESLMGADTQGVPMVCGVQTVSAAQSKFEANPENLAGVPAGMRGWEVIPSVIRGDGVETFRVEVHANGPMQAVRCRVPINLFTTNNQNGLYIDLRDDGQGGDRIAGDYIFTSGQLRYNRQYPVFDYYQNDTNSPSGIEFVELFYTQLVETNGVTNRFLIDPMVGILGTNIPITTVVSVTSNLSVSSHLINIKTSRRDTQRRLRFAGDTLTLGTSEIYQSIPDYFDFLMFFSADHIEYLPYNYTYNFNAGVHQSVKVNYTGTGPSPYTNNFLYGSSGRLLGVNVLDTHKRGIESRNAAHEIVHQWSYHQSSALGAGDNSHYNIRSGVGSLVGGYQLATNAFGQRVLNCSEGPSGATLVSPLDKYMMGLLTASQVPTQYVYSSSLPYPLNYCDTPITNFETILTVSNLIAAHGPRTPGPATAQRDFSIGFIMETYERLLNPVEFTFFNRLAEHFCKPLPTNQPAPRLYVGWAPITRFFGEDTTWRSDTRVLTNVTPNIERLSNGTHRVSGIGAPSLRYRVLVSSNLAQWATLTNVVTTTNGFFQIQDLTQSTQRFYRLIWP
jgi:hypothetical protein